MVADVRRRQERGEIAADLDPTAVLLTLFSAALAPTLLPHVVERVTGKAADSPEFLDEYAARLAQIVERLVRERASHRHDRQFGAKGGPDLTAFAPNRRSPAAVVNGRGDHGGGAATGRVPSFHAPNPPIRSDTSANPAARSVDAAIEDR